MKKVVTFSDRQKITDEAGYWILRLESDDGLSQKEKTELYVWLDQSAAHREHFERLAKVWTDANILTELAVPLPEVKKVARLFSKLQFVGLAAMLILAIGIAGYGVVDGDNSVQENGVVATEIGSQKTIALGDGSVLKLNTNSRLRIDYSEQFRDIHLLSGEAHFTVAKNKNRPFRVYAGKGRIHAIGTAFSVYLKGSQVDVTVSEGRVGVAAISDDSAPTRSETPGSVIKKPVKSLGMLRAGEAGAIVSQFDVNAQSIQKLEKLEELTDVDVAKRVAWTRGVLIFAGEPLEDVVKEIGRYTEVKIKFANPEIRNIRIGGNFPVGETETMFSSLETNFGLVVRRLDSDHVVISSGRRFN